MGVGVLLLIAASGYLVVWQADGDQVQGPDQGAYLVQGRRLSTGGTLLGDTLGFGDGELRVPVRLKLRLTGN